MKFVMTRDFKSAGLELERRYILRAYSMCNQSHISLFHSPLTIIVPSVWMEMRKYKMLEYGTHSLMKGESSLHNRQILIWCASEQFIFEGHMFLSSTRMSTVSNPIELISTCVWGRDLFFKYLLDSWIETTGVQVQLNGLSLHWSYFSWFLSAGFCKLKRFREPVGISKTVESINCILNSKNK